MRKNDFFVSLRRDMPHVLWSGIQLRPEADLQFRLELFSGECRLIRLQLVRADGASVALVTGSSFEMGSLGKDHERLETLAADLVVITRCVSKIWANMEPDGGVLLHLDVLGNEQLFKLYAREDGHLIVDRWDWFVDPTLVVGSIPIHVARPICESAQLAT